MADTSIVPTIGLSKTFTRLKKQGKVSKYLSFWFQIHPFTFYFGYFDVGLLVYLLLCILSLWLSCCLIIGHYDLVWYGNGVWVNNFKFGLLFYVIAPLLSEISLGDLVVFWRVLSGLICSIGRQLWWILAYGVFEYSKKRCIIEEPVELHSVFWS